MHVDKDTSNGPYGESRKFEVCSLSGAIGYDSWKDRDSYASGRTVCPEGVNLEDWWTTSNQRGGLSAANEAQRVSASPGKTAGYSVIINESEECTISVIPGGRICML